MTNNARTAQELAKLQENAANYAAWCDGYAAEAKGHGNDSSAMHYEGMAFVLRQLAALASQAEPVELLKDGKVIPTNSYSIASQAEQSEDGIPSFASRREAIVRAWNDLPESLRCHPGLKALYRALSGAAIAAKEQQS